MKSVSEIYKEMLAATPKFPGSDLPTVASNDLWLLANAEHDKLCALETLRLQVELSLARNGGGK